MQFSHCMQYTERNYIGFISVIVMWAILLIKSSRIQFLELTSTEQWG